MIKELKIIACTLEGSGLDYCLCGGLALAVYAEPRATLDIDIVVKKDQLEAVMKTLAGIGYRELSEPMRFEKEKIEIRRLLKLEEEKPAMKILDLCLPDQKAFPEVWQGWSRVMIEGAPLWVVSRAGLIALKKARSSQKDLADIELLDQEPA